jgi:hypothetical protein
LIFERSPLEPCVQTFHAARKLLSLVLFVKQNWRKQRH